MAKLSKKFFIDFVFANLDDVAVASPAEGEVIRYDESNSKFKNVRTDELIPLTKKEYLEKVTIPDGTRCYLVQPEFLGDIEVEGSSILEIGG